MVLFGAQNRAAGNAVGPAGPAELPVGDPALPPGAVVHGAASSRLKRWGLRPSWPRPCGIALPTISWRPKVISPIGRRRYTPAWTWRAARMPSSVRTTTTRRSTAVLDASKSGPVGPSGIGHPGVCGPGGPLAGPAPRSHNGSRAPPGSQVTSHTRYFISRGPPRAQPWLAAMPGPWGIENSLHWVLEVAFREDEGRLRQGHAALNLVVLRRIAHPLLGRHTSTN